MCMWQPQPGQLCLPCVKPPHTPHGAKASRAARASAARAAAAASRAAAGAAAAAAAVDARAYAGSPIPAHAAIAPRPSCPSRTSASAFLARSAAAGASAGAAASAAAAAAAGGWANTLFAQLLAVLLLRGLFGLGRGSVNCARLEPSLSNCSSRSQSSKNRPRKLDHLSTNLSGSGTAALITLSVGSLLYSHLVWISSSCPFLRGSTLSLHTCEAHTW